MMHKFFTIKGIWNCIKELISGSKRKYPEPMPCGKCEGTGQQDCNKHSLSCEYPSPCAIQCKVCGGDGMLKIRQAAVQCGDEVFTLPRPNRHNHIYKYVGTEHGKSFSSTGKAGFLTTDGRFVDIHEAALIAIASGQIEKTIAPSILTSEDLW